MAPVLLLLVYLPGHMLLRCRIDGLLRSTCCCTHEGEKQSSGPVLRAQDCCAREITQNQRPTAEAARPPSRDVAPVEIIALVVTPAVLLEEPTEQFDRAVQRHGPVHEGPGLILLKQAFLI